MQGVMGMTVPDLTLVKIIGEPAAGLKSGERTEIKFPYCGGKLIVSKSKNNGHVWGVCQNEKCGANISS